MAPPSQERMGKLPDIKVQLILIFDWDHNKKGPHPQSMVLFYH